MGIGQLDGREVVIKTGAFRQFSWSFCCTVGFRIEMATILEKPGYPAILVRRPGKPSDQ